MLRRVIIGVVLWVVVVWTNSLWAGQSDRNCYTIIVGKAATVDGSVLVAHNEDDDGDLLVDWHKVERKKYTGGSTVKLHNGGTLEQVSETAGFLWLQIPEVEFGDSYLNEYGVMVTSNATSSREDAPELTSGGIGFMLRRLVAERAQTARQAVEIAGKLVEQFGYAHPGRSYTFADGNEGWVFSIIHGKHWAARRVPDDQVAIIPNYYPLQTLNLSDSRNYLASKGLVDYAIDRGWYNPNVDRQFDFRSIFGKRGTLTAIWNVPRHLHGLNRLTDTTYTYWDKKPFSSKPAKKLKAADLMSLLADHFEGSQFEMHPDFNNGNPHENSAMRICSRTNQYGFVAQLRKDLPKEIGNVMWVAPRRPCLQPFIPWYLGITEIPAQLTTGDADAAWKTHFDKLDRRKTAKQHAFWQISDFAASIDTMYKQQHKNFQQKKITMEKRILSDQAAIEKKLLAVFKKDPQKAVNVLNKYTEKLVTKALSLFK